MAGWSSLAFRNVGKTALIRSVLASKNGLTSGCKFAGLNYIPARASGSANVFVVKPGQFKFRKLLDLSHFYFVLGVLPIGALILYCNIFIGPPKLAPIPEGYVPQHWEYYEHPITRWFARRFPSPQQNYEKELHRIHILGIKYKIRQVEDKVIEFMRERDDYQAWYFVDTGAKYVRKVREAGDAMEKAQGKLMGLVK